MNDWREFAVLGDTGENSQWSRYVNEPEFDAFYTVGGPIKIAYIMHRTRGTPVEFRKVPIEIRVDENA